jgi:hypothetical protein
MTLHKNVDAYLKTGDFPEGTVIVKELTGLRTQLSQTDRASNHPVAGSSMAC